MWIEDTGLQARERPVPGFDVLVGGPVTVDRVVEHGSVLASGDGLPFEVFHTPGHSRGSVSSHLRVRGKERPVFPAGTHPDPALASIPRKRA